MRFYFLPELRNGREDSGEDRRTASSTTTIMRIQVAHTHSSLFPFLYCLLTQFLAFLRPFLSSPFILPCTRFLAARLRLGFSSPAAFLLLLLLLLLLPPLHTLLLLPLLEATYRLVAFQSPKSGRTSSRQAGLSRTRDLVLSACTFLNDVPCADSARV